MEIETRKQGKIVVEVKDSHGAQAPIQGCQVNITPTTTAQQNVSRVCEGVTDTDGKFECFCDPGTYTVEVTAFKKTDSHTVTVEEGQTDYVNVGIRIGFNSETRVKTEGRDVLLPSEETTEGTLIVFSASHELPSEDFKIDLTTSGGSILRKQFKAKRAEATIDTHGQSGEITLKAILSDNPQIVLTKSFFVLPQRAQNVSGSMGVAMRRTATSPTSDLPLWLVIKNTTEDIRFDNYLRFMDLVLCGDGRADTDGKRAVQDSFNRLSKKRALPYNDVDAYRLLKVATEAFLMVNCGVALPLITGGRAIDQGFRDLTFTQPDLEELIHRVSLDPRQVDLDNLWRNYLKPLVNGLAKNVTDETIPYLALIRDKLGDVRLKNSFFAADDSRIDMPQAERCFGILRSKITNPCLIELIWSYWHEEGMLVQTMNALSQRFQNIRGPGDHDPLAMLEIDPLRPLNNLLWGHIQDEQHRLSVVRRAYEYDHHYGLSLYGKAVPALRPADSRSKFLEAFHNLLYLCSIFFKEDDDTTVIADAFPLMNALKEVHFVLTEGAHNQFGDLPSTARIEMLIQQYILARPEFREFLPTRIMVAYPEPWMDRVDAMKKLQGWTDVSIREFNGLGMFGEQILLTIRYGAWSTVNDAQQASNWARFWRPEIQGYIHSYRAVTGVDLTNEVTDTRQAADRYLQPSIHLRNRLAMQLRGSLPAASQMALEPGDDAMQPGVSRGLMIQQRRNR
jgi:hypothetical protein